MPFAVLHVHDMGSGRLFVMPAPPSFRLREQIDALSALGVTKVLSLMDEDEQFRLHLGSEPTLCAERGIAFERYPIPDHGVPEPSGLAALIPRLSQDLQAGEPLVVHCFGGIGRTGLVAACLLIEAGLSPDSAMRHISEKRGVPMPETNEQIALVRAYDAQCRTSSETGNEKTDRFSQGSNCT